VRQLARPLIPTTSGPRGGYVTDYHNSLSNFAIMTHRKFHIRTDMEGISGVVNLSQVTPGSAEYRVTCDWLMAELLALVEGLIEGGATDISIYDEHWFGRNVDVSRLPAGVRVLAGKPPYRADWAGGLASDHAGMILHGLHSMAGTGEVLAHTYEPDFEAITINGRQVGEIGVEAAIAGDSGVPLVLISADSAGVAEAQALVPDVASVVTKISWGATGAECRALADVVHDLKTAGRRVAANRPTVAPFVLSGPVTMECAFVQGAYLDELRRQKPGSFTGRDKLCLAGPTVSAVWADYWQIKLAVQAALLRRTQN
jgi:D-amino peptidase